MPGRKRDPYRGAPAGTIQILARNRILQGAWAGCTNRFPFHVIEVNHIQPYSRGRMDILANLRLLPGGCNRHRGAKTMVGMAGGRMTERAAEIA